MSEPPANGRINRWIQHLLDLSMRNRLLNLRNISFTLPLVCDNLEQMEDNLARRALKVLHYTRYDRTEEWEGKESLFIDDTEESATSSRDVLYEVMSSDSEEALLEESVLDKEKKSYSNSEEKKNDQPHTDNNFVWVDLTQKEFEKRIVKLYRQAKLDIDEGGVNTLFLTLGSLLWTDKKSVGKYYSAPIILIPVQLTRENAKSPFFLKRTDDEPIVNPTLMELLRRDYGINFPELERLEQDAENGLNVTEVIKIITNKVSAMKDWLVEYKAWLGRFSFDKFIMYTDLNTRWEELAANKVVNDLVNLSETQSTQGVMEGQSGTLGAENESGDTPIVPALEEEPETPWKESDYSELFIPVSADASQKQAILQSGTGKSFVLYGPPGTGKSQTITNIIAYNLAKGRKVLFVSEKRAALEVVYNRLSKIGLAPYCLELHSNKAVKRAILDQFQDVYELGIKRDDKQQWNSTCCDVSETELELNNYIRHLHKPIVDTITPYDCFGWLSEHQKNTPLFNLNFYDGALDQPQTLEIILKQTDRLQSHASQISPSVLKGLAPIRVLDWTPGCETKIVQAAKAFEPAINAIKQQFQIINEKLNLPDFLNTPGRMLLASEIMAFMQTPGILPDYLLTEDFGKFMPSLEKYIEQKEILLKTAKELELFDLNRIAMVNYNRLADLVSSARNSFFLFRYFKQNSIVKEYTKLLLPENRPLTFSMLDSALKSIREYKDAYFEVQKYENSCALIARFRNINSSQFPLLSEQLKRAKKLREIFVKAGLNTQQQHFVFDFVNKQFKLNSPEFSTLSVQFRSAVKEYLKQLGIFNQIVSTNKLTVDQALDLVHSLASAGNELRLFSLWLDMRAEAKQIGLGNLASALESGLIPADSSVLIAAEGSYRWRLVQNVLVSDPILKKFDALNQYRAINQFHELDDRLFKQAQKKILAMLSTETTRVVSQSVQKNSPMKEEGDLLRREIGKKMRFIPLRVLLERAPNLTRQLKPCFLMSPLSVAQYLPTNDAGFDLVVFDEASQITTWDAVGAIARGKQAIIVGDPKQLPPTTFFQRQDSDKNAVLEDESDAIEDLESILDECIAIGMDGMYLKTHYRSRHESLIAFSNHFYYKDALGTFPSPDRHEDLSPRNDQGDSPDENAESTNAHTSNEVLQQVDSDTVEQRETEISKEALEQTDQNNSITTPVAVIDDTPESIIDNEIVDTESYDTIKDDSIQTDEHSLTNNDNGTGEGSSDIPSFDLQTRGVHFVFVPNGVYDRSKTRTNRNEAQRVVDIVLARLLDPQTAARSIGIATFSVTQKELIEDLLDTAAKKYPVLSATMSDSAEEPLFVKNLENIQGDERDCIIFSIGYAPDANGSFAMNFGPLNKNGGQRRLNVAITRAKEEVIVVSSIHASQIQLGRISSLGPAHLKAYLEYAEAGEPTWSEDASSKVESISAPETLARKDFFAQNIADFLTENGYEVERNIGFSEYKVDVAVIDPNNPLRYCLGIECDGMVYKKAKTARDRDILRPAVMESLGWNRCRIWSEEWFINPEKTKANLLKTLESLT